MTNDDYLTYYKLNLMVIVKEKTILNINQSDIVSLAIVNNYDTKTYPMIRLRLFTDITFLQALTDAPDELRLAGTIDGGIYRLIPNETPVIVSPTQSINLSMKVYIEYKNTPTSKMDKYVNGMPRTTDGSLNVNNKVPVELYCYNYDLIHRMNDRPQSVYKNMNLSTIISSMMDRIKITDYQIDMIRNQKRYDQVLIPNLSMLDTLSFFDITYGLYPKGGSIFGSIDKLYICNLDSNNGTHPLPIYVKSYKNNSGTSGMMKIGGSYFMQTESSSVSVLSESDIEKVLTSETLVSTNVNTLSIDKENLPALKESMHSNNGLITPTQIDNISPELILHKTPNDYVASAAAARINEKITKIDVSGNGFDITKFTPNARYNLIFDSPIRGINMADSYRASYVCNILSPSSQELFTSTTTMTLCKN